MPDWEFEKAGHVVKVAPPGRLIVTHSGLARRAALDGVGFWPTFEDYVREAVESGELISVLDDWCAPFPGPFLYYPSRRQPPPALAAFVAFVAEWRKQEAKGKADLLIFLTLLHFAGEKVKRGSQHARQHAVRRFVVVEEGADVDDNLLAHLDPAFDRRRAHMRQQRYLAGLRQPHQFRIDRGFVLVDVQAGAGDVAGFDQFDQRVFVDYLAARGVADIAALPPHFHPPPPHQITRPGPSPPSPPTRLP